MLNVGDVLDLLNIKNLRDLVRADTEVEVQIHTECDVVRSSDSMLNIDVADTVKFVTIRLVLPDFTWQSTLDINGYDNINDVMVSINEAEDELARYLELSVDR
jgi:hypothetical protein